MFEWHQHRVIDASAVSLRFAAASLSRDTLCSGRVTVGRVFRERTDHQWRGLRRYIADSRNNPAYQKVCRPQEIRPAPPAVGDKGLGMSALQRARAHSRRGRRLVSVQRLRDYVANFADLLDTDPDDPEVNALRRDELIGRPLGSPDFLDRVSRLLNRLMTSSKRGRKPKAARPCRRLDRQGH
jgi:hypothetical protein